jgi:hypothetical protein
MQESIGNMMAMRGARLKQLTSRMIQPYFSESMLLGPFAMPK